MSYPRYISTPSSGSIEQIADSATTIPDSCTDFFAAIARKGSSRPRKLEWSSMQTYRYVVVDVFTDRPLAGNQLAVFTDARGLEDETMQALAKEMNYSESTFVLPAEEGGHARMRIFTPVQELPFAGHPTLGTAFVLGGPLQLQEIRLETRAGIVPVRLERDESRIVFGRMEQPAPT